MKWEQPLRCDFPGPWKWERPARAFFFAALKCTPAMADDIIEAHPMADSIPRRDIDLLAWAQALNRQIIDDPLRFGVPRATSAAFTAALAELQTAWQLASEPSTRTGPVIARKNSARVALLNIVRPMARLIAGTANVTTQQRINLGLSTRLPGRPSGRRSNRLRPAQAPVVRVLSCSGQTVMIRVSDALVSWRRRIAPGMSGAAVFTFVGEKPPGAGEKWNYSHAVSRVDFVPVKFPAALAPGTKVWIAACWQNNVGVGPASQPAYAFIAGGEAIVGSAAAGSERAETTSARGTATSERGTATSEREAATSEREMTIIASSPTIIPATSATATEASNAASGASNAVSGASNAASGAPNAVSGASNAASGAPNAASGAATIIPATSATATEAPNAASGASNAASGAANAASGAANAASGASATIAA